MAFFEQRFDERLSFGAVGGPVWNTRVARVNSGKRYVNKEWSTPLHRYNVSPAIRDISDFEVIQAFFYVVAGQYDGFRFKDWRDYQATQANSRVSVKSGSPAEWQLQRIYTVGSREFVRAIYKPVSGVVVRRRRAGVWSNASDATVQTTTGTVQFSSHQSGDTYAWIGEFDVPVAFTTDEMMAEIVDRDEEFLVKWPNVTLEELRNEDFLS